MRPTLTLNRAFVRALLAAEPPCWALGLVEERGRPSGLLALRPAEAIPLEVTEAGCNVGQAVFGSAAFEVLHCVVAFSGFQTSKVLMNPNNPLVQTVPRRLRDDGESFFCALEATGRVTTFRTALGQATLSQVHATLVRLQPSTITRTVAEARLTQKTQPAYIPSRGFPHECAQYPSKHQDRHARCRGRL